MLAASSDVGVGGMHVPYACHVIASVLSVIGYVGVSVSIRAFSLGWKSEISMPGDVWHHAFLLWGNPAGTSTSCVPQWFLLKACVCMYVCVRACVCMCVGGEQQAGTSPSCIHEATHDLQRNARMLVLCLY